MSTNSENLATITARVSGVSMFLETVSESLTTESALLLDQSKAIDQSKDSGKKIVSDFNNIFLDLRHKLDLLKKELTALNERAIKAKETEAKELSRAISALIDKIENYYYQDVVVQLEKIRSSFSNAPTIPTVSADIESELPTRAGQKQTQTSASVSSWLNEEVISRVKRHLEEMVKREKSEGRDGTDQRLVIEMLDKYYDEYKSAKDPKAKTDAQNVLYNIIHFPGWGYVSDPRDEYRATSQAVVTSRNRDALRKVAEENLEGTEHITHEVLDEANLLMQKMVALEGESEGEVLDPDDVGKMPVFCIDGPPGTGKTTVAKAIAKSLDMGFYDISMSGKTETSLVYGLGPSYKNPTPGLVADVMLKTKRERNVILLDEVEKIGSKPLKDSLGQILEVNQKGYKDVYFNGTTIDKRKNLFILTTNEFGLLPDFIQSRVRRVYLPGYTDEVKIKILKNMIPKTLGRLHQSIQFESSDPSDENRVWGKNKSKFKGFKHVADKEDVIQFLVKNYVSEPGVREAEDMLRKIIARANKTLSTTSTRPLAINTQFIMDALGPPEKNIVRIKQLNQLIDEENKGLYKVRSSIIEEIDKLKKSPSESKAKLTELVAQLKNHKEKLLGYERDIVDAIKGKTNKSKLTQTQIEEHEQTIKNLDIWPNALIREAEAILNPSALKAKSADVSAMQPTAGVEAPKSLTPATTIAPSLVLGGAASTAGTTLSFSAAHPRPRERQEIPSATAAASRTHLPSLQIDMPDSARSAFLPLPSLSVGEEPGAALSHYVPKTPTAAEGTVLYHLQMRANKVGQKSRKTPVAFDEKAWSFLLAKTENHYNKLTAFDPDAAAHGGKYQNAKVTATGEKYSADVYHKQAEIKSKVFNQWTVAIPATSAKIASSFDLQRNGEAVATIKREPETGAKISRVNIISKKSDPDPLDVLHMVENACNIARSKGTQKVTIANCGNAPETAILMEDLITRMGFKPDYAKAPDLSEKAVQACKAPPKNYTLETDNVLQMKWDDYKVQIANKYGHRNERDQGLAPT